MIKAKIFFVKLVLIQYKNSPIFMGEHSLSKNNWGKTLVFPQTPLALLPRNKALRSSRGGAGLSVNPSGTSCHLPQQGESPHTPAGSGGSAAGGIADECRQRLNIGSEATNL